MNNNIQRFLTFFYQQPRLGRMGLKGLNLSLKMVLSTPLVRDYWPWTNPAKNSMSYLPAEAPVRTASRKIEVDRSVDTPSQFVLPEALLEKLIDQSTQRVIMDFCICRNSHECQHYRHDIGCLFMGAATAKLPPGLCRPAERDEAKAHVRKALENGLVPLAGKVNVDNTGFLILDRKTLLSVCFCCHCCCMMGYFRHGPARHLDRIFPVLEGVSITVTEACQGCGTCVETCIFQAITIQNGKAIHSDKCRGCGRCVRACPQQAVSLSLEDWDTAQKFSHRISTRVSF